jgi:hypothetical protein
LFSKPFAISRRFVYEALPSYYQAIMKKLPLLAILLGLCLSGRTGYSAEPTDNSPDYKGQAVAALKRGDTKAATEIALQLLKAKAPEDKPLEKRDADAIHDANQILGLAAVREQRIDDAKRYLLEAGKTPGSTQLELFGPNMRLAQTLVNRGERNVVIEYLDLVSKFWGNLPEAHRKELKKKSPDLLEQIDFLNQENIAYLMLWKKEIRAGRKPLLNHYTEY